MPDSVGPCNSQIVGQKKYTRHIRNVRQQSIIGLAKPALYAAMSSFFATAEGLCLVNGIQLKRNPELMKGNVEAEPDSNFETVG